MKTCIKCQKSCDPSFFDVRSDTGKLRGECKACRRRYKVSVKRLSDPKLSYEERSALRAKYKKNNQIARDKRKKIRDEQAILRSRLDRYTCRRCNTVNSREAFRFYMSSRYKILMPRTVCLTCEAAVRRNKEVTVSGKFSNYKNDAKRRSLSFTLSKKEFSDLLKQPCKYCKKDPAGGVDRFDNKLGYSNDNCVPCCSACNELKMDWEYSSWINHLSEILKVCRGVECH